MYALLLIIAVSTGGVTSSVTYFPDKAACDWQATWMSADMSDSASHWIEHAYIHCMKLGSTPKGSTP